MELKYLIINTEDEDCPHHHIISSQVVLIITLSVVFNIMVGGIPIVVRFEHVTAGAWDLR